MRDRVSSPVQQDGDGESMYHHVPYHVLKAAVVCVCVPRVACSNWLSQAAMTLERTSLWYCSPFSSTPGSLS